MSAHKRNRWADALQVFSKLHAQRFKADLVCYRAIMHAFGEAKQWQHAVWLFSQLRELEIPDAATYRIASRPEMCFRASVEEVLDAAYATESGRRIFSDALRQRIFAFEEAQEVLDLHEHSRGSALLMLAPLVGHQGPEAHGDHGLGEEPKRGGCAGARRGLRKASGAGDARGGAWRRSYSLVSRPIWAYIDMY